MTANIFTSVLIILEVKLYYWTNSNDINDLIIKKLRCVTDSIPVTFTFTLGQRPAAQLHRCRHPAYQSWKPGKGDILASPTSVCLRQLVNFLCLCVFDCLPMFMLNQVSFWLTVYTSLSVACLCLPVCMSVFCLGVCLYVCLGVCVCVCVYLIMCMPIYVCLLIKSKMVFLLHSWRVLSLHLFEGPSSSGVLSVAFCFSNLFECGYGWTTV